MSERVLALVLLGQVSIFALQRLGCPTLHASAVFVPSGGCAFLGRKGQGKSTLSSSFLSRGVGLLTDDALPLRVQNQQVCGGPSVPIMKLWKQTAECTLGLSEELPSLFDAYPKKLLSISGRYQFADSPVPIRAVYALDRYDPAATGRRDIVIRRANQREGVLMLLEHTALRPFLQTRDVADLLPMYARLVMQSPVRMLRYPSGFEYQQAVYERVMADLEQDT